MTQKVTLTFVDTETTGLIDKYPEAEITEIAIVSWCDGDVKVDLHERVKPKRGMPAEAAPFNKSYNEKEWAKADPWDVAATQAVAELLKGKYICGSNPDFDKRMITAECFRIGEQPPKWHHRGVNTATLGFPLYLTGAVQQTGLGELARYFHIDHAEHTALGDCYAAIGVWEAFWDLYIYRPAKMKEALEQLSARVDNGKIQTLAYARDVALQGLVGE